MVRIAALQDAEQLEILNNETECTSRSLDIFYNMSISNECAAKRMLSIADIEGKDECECQNIIGYIFKNEKKDYSPLIKFIYHTYIKGFDNVGGKCKDCSLYSSCLVFKVARK